MTAGSKPRKPAKMKAAGPTDAKLKSGKEKQRRAERCYRFRQRRIPPKLK